jgi:hypothetical protein
MTACNESKGSQAQGRGLTQGTVPVWKKGLQTLKNCAMTGGVPTDLSNPAPLGHKSEGFTA